MVALAVVPQFTNVTRTQVADAVYANMQLTDEQPVEQLTQSKYEILEDVAREVGNKAVVVEYSVFKNRQVSMANGADVVIAVLAPLDDRIERAVATRLRLGRRPVSARHGMPDWNRHPGILPGDGRTGTKPSDVHL